MREELGGLTANVRPNSNLQGSCGGLHQFGIKLSCFS
ncbi:(Na+)-NQR maturation NqrM [Bremerella sp. TYQ1]|nr:(Na+)-NQR maturation NqrM [Bremerella volcania]